MIDYKMILLPFLISVILTPLVSNILFIVGPMPKKISVRSIMERFRVLVV